MAGVTWRTKLAGHWSDPLYRNGYFLAASSVLSSVLGLAFWTLATALFEPAEIGVGSAAIATMVFLANLSSFNLFNGLNRFVPRGGHATPRIIVGSYLVAGSAGLAAGALFVAGVDIWAPTLGFVRESAGMIVWFPVAVGAWTIFVLQDGALTGLRAAHWVTVENLIFAIAKIAVLIFVADALTDSGVFVAWTVPVVPVVVVVNALMFLRLVPKHVRATRDDPEHVTGRILRAFVAGDYAASLVWTGTVSLLPVIVLERTSAAETAYFYLAWSVAYVLYLIGRNFGMSMLTETTADPSAAAVLTYRTLRQTTLLMIPAVAVLVIAAPLVLRLFGQEYSTEGASLLRLLAIASLPTVVTTIYTALLRAERRMKRLVVLMSVLAVVVLGLSWFLLGTMGITGVGVAWLVGQSVVAAVLLVTGLRSLLLANLSPRFIESLGALRDRAMQLRGHRSDRAYARAVLDSLADTLGHPSWVPLRSLSSLTDVRAVTVGDPGGRPGAIIKTGRSGKGETSIQRSTTALERASENGRLDPLRSTIPPVLGHGYLDGRVFVMERHLGGLPATRLLAKPGVLETTIGEAADWAATLTRRTVDPGVSPVDWLNRRTAIILDQLRAGGAADATIDAARAMADRLGQQLTPVPSAMIHGDFWLGNLLVDEADGHLVGVIDWDASDVAGPVDFDLVSLLVTTRVALEGRETGQVVLELIEADERWDERERQLLEAAHDLQWAAGVTAIIALWWHSAALNLEVSERYRPGSPWYVRNFEAVLHRL